MPDTLHLMVCPQAKAGEVRQKPLSGQSTTPRSLQRVIRTSFPSIPLKLLHNLSSSTFIGNGTDPGNFDVVCDEDTPHVITHVETTLATTPDDKMLDTIHAALAERALLPQEHLVDCGDTDAEILVGSDQAYGVTIVGPVAADPSWQAREATGYDNSAFTIDWESHTATCPQGKQSRKWQPDQDVVGQDVIQIRFAKKDCQACP